MSLIKNRERGSDITIINNWYRKPQRNENTGKYDDGSMTVVYRDNVTGKKHQQYVKNPACRFYIAKSDVELDHNCLFIEESKVDKYIVPYKDQLKAIAELTGNTNFYFDNIRNGNRQANNSLYANVRVFDADYDLENHWRALFAEQYTNTPGVINKAYLDIEVDSINAMGDFPEPGECPINAVTVIDERTNEVHTFILENDNNPLIMQFKYSLDENFQNEIKEFIRKQVGGWKNEIRFGLDKLSFKFHFFPEDEEIRLIQAVFDLINEYQPDFVLAWNMAFDIPYIIERIKKLGYRPEDIICHKDFTEKIVKYFIDEKNYNEYAERGDNATISSYSIFIDQMIQFASRRKGQAALPSYRLDDIGALVAKVHKYDYHHITTQIKMLPYLDFKTFILYNIMDTVVQKCIEVRTKDIDYLFTKCLNNDTKYNKAHRQTIYLRNRGSKSFRTENDDVYIIGTNVNQLNPPTDNFKGAFVANAQKITDYAKVRICGIPIMIFLNLIDYDFASLYPSTMRQMNLAPNTIIGFIDIPNPVFENENRYNVDRFVRGGSFLEDYQCHVFLEFGSRWFNLADYSTLYDDVVMYLNSMYRPIGVYNSYNNTINPFIIRNPDIVPDPIIMNSDKLIDPFIVMAPIPNDCKYTKKSFEERQYVNIKF